MQITVKSSKVGSTGTSQKGAWELIVVTSADNTDYTTFHKGAKNLVAGTVIDIGEPKIEGGKCSFKEYTVVSEALAPVVEENRNGMTPELWAEKDRLERWSKECNTCFMGIMEITKNQAPEGKLKDVYDAALDWAMAHFKGTKQTEKDAEELWPKNPPHTEAVRVAKLVEQQESTDEIKTQIADLLTFVAEKKGWKSPTSARTVRTWLVNACKIPEDLIDTNPQGVYEQLKVHFPEWF